MSNGVEHVGTELTDSELALVQGGGFFGDVWNGIKKGANAVADAARDAYNWARSDSGKGVLGGAATLIGLIFGASRK